MQVKHRFNVEVPDDPDAQAEGQVLPSHWNQDHEFLVDPVSLVGNDGAVTSPAKAISVGSGLRLFAGALSLLGVPVFFQAEQPEVQGKYVWVQDLGSGNFTIFVEDGVA